MVQILKNKKECRGLSKKKAKDKGVHTYYDYSLLVLTLFLIGFGLIMIYSTSSYNATRYMGDPMYYLKRQGLFALLGIPLQYPYTVPQHSSVIPTVVKKALE